MTDEQRLFDLPPFPDLNDARPCRGCGEMKPPSEFMTHSQSPNFAYPWCRACERRHQQLVTSLHYGELVALQGGEHCRICLRPPVGRRLHIDIDRAVWKPRGLLDFNCNSGLGKFYDNPRLLLRAADYLLAPHYLMPGEGGVA